MITHGSVRNIRRVLWQRYSMIPHESVRDIKGTLLERMITQGPVRNVRGTL
jgi:hypothetical protein